MQAMLRQLASHDKATCHGKSIAKSIKPQSIPGECVSVDSLESSKKCSYPDVINSHMGKVHGSNPLYCSLLKVVLCLHAEKSNQLTKIKIAFENFPNLTACEYNTIMQKMRNQKLLPK